MLKSKKTQIHFSKKYKKYGQNFQTLVLYFHVNKIFLNLYNSKFFTPRAYFNETNEKKYKNQYTK